MVSTDRTRVFFAWETVTRKMIGQYPQITEHKRIYRTSLTKLSPLCSEAEGWNREKLQLIRSEHHDWFA